MGAWVLSSAASLAPALLPAPTQRAYVTVLLCCADNMTDSKPLEEASTALTQWLSPEHCGHLLAAVISKYIALTPEELQEWQASLHLDHMVLLFSAACSHVKQLQA